MHTRLTVAVATVAAVAVVVAAAAAAATTVVVFCSPYGDEEDAGDAEEQDAGDAEEQDADEVEEGGGGEEGGEDGDGRRAPLNGQAPRLSWLLLLSAIDGEGGGRSRDTARRKSSDGGE
jgi:hypothetical protein